MENLAYHAIPMHIHSIHEREASMEGQMYNAHRLGIHYMWFTDHDTRMGPKKYEACGYDFEKCKLLDERPGEDVASRLAYAVGVAQQAGFELNETQIAQISRRYVKPWTDGFRITADDGCAGELSEDAPHTGNCCMRLSASGTDGAWRKVTADWAASGKRDQTALTSVVTLRLWVRIPKPLGNHARLTLRIRLSQRPPDWHEAAVSYVMGRAEPGEVALPCSGDGWRELCINPAVDAEGGMDNVFGGFSITLESCGEPVEVYIDDVSKEARYAWNDARREQGKLARELGARFDITPFVAAEISGIGGDMNCFSTTVPIINYAERGYKVTRAEAVAHVRAHGGLISLNHPMASYGAFKMTDEQREQVIRFESERLAHERVYGADLIEVGFVEGRAGFSMADHLRIWDAIGMAGVFVTGYGDSDAHTCRADWFDGNNYCGFIWGDGTEAGFTASMKAGRMFFGDPAAFQGTAEYDADCAGIAVRMGQAVRIDALTVTFRVSGGAEGTVRFIVDGVCAAERPVGADFAETLEVTRAGMCTVVRAELIRSDGRPVLLTNPIYLCDGTVEIPEERRV